MITDEVFLTESLRNHIYGKAISRVLTAAIRAVEPGAAVERYVHYSGSILDVNGIQYDLRKYHHVCLLGIGKASLAMSIAAAGILGSRLERGLVVTKRAAQIQFPPIIFMVGDHPVPGFQSFNAGRKGIEFISSMGKDDLLICLFSGGASSLVFTPRAGFNLDDAHLLTSKLLSVGANIAEINVIRRHLEALKGGGIVASSGATIISLILSDVIGDSLETIASGPTAPDPSSHMDVEHVIEKYELFARLPQRILQVLKQPLENPKPGDPIFERVQNVIVGNNQQAIKAAQNQAVLENFLIFPHSIKLQGEARKISQEFLDFLNQEKSHLVREIQPVCIVAGGETTVTLSGRGKGGRNTELALASVVGLADFPEAVLVTLASDGEDGPTDAAGAVVTATTLARGRIKGLKPADFLDRNDSYTYFDVLHDLLKPGSTGTNVCDLAFLFNFPG